MKYDNIGVTNFCNFLTGAGGIDCLGYDLSTVSKVDLYRYVEAKTDNFNPIIFKIFIEELRDCANDLKFLMPNTHEGVMTHDLFYTIDSLGPFFPEIEPPLTFATIKTLRERVDEIIKLLPAVQFKKKVKKLLLLSDIAEKEYQRTIEITDPDNLKVNKSKLNRRQKIALLESVGVMKYLESTVFSGNQTQMANFLSIIIDFDQQNIRRDINNAPELLLNDTKITKVINPILLDLGLKSKE